MDPQQLTIMANKFQSVLDATVLNDRGQALAFSERHLPISRPASVHGGYCGRISGLAQLCLLAPLRTPI